MRVWVCDEMRFGLKPVTRRVWTLRGHEAVVPVKPAYEYGYTYGALEAGGLGGAVFMHSPTVCKDASLRFIEEVAEIDEAAHHIVIWDGAGFHQRAGDESLPGNVSLITLPAYSPELNPIERLWDIVKDGICNRVFSCVDEAQAAVDAVLRLFWESPSRVASLVADAWLTLPANDSNPRVYSNL